jgi:hypothetical protein
MKKYYTYGIFINSTIIYVGKGTGNRKDHHLKNFLLHNTAVNRILRSKLSKATENGDKIDVTILVDNLSEDEALIQEANLIQKYGKKVDGTGMLCNITDGGTQPPSTKTIRSLYGEEKYSHIKQKKEYTRKINLANKIQQHIPIISQMLKDGNMLKDIAAKLNVSTTTIRLWMRKYNIVMNYTGKKNKIKQHLQKYRQINNQKPNCNAKLYTVKEPSGNLHKTRLLKQFCNTRNLDYSNLRATFKRGGSHKGYSIVAQQEPETL